MNEIRTNVEIKDTQLESIAGGESEQIIPKFTIICQKCRVTYTLHNVKYLSVVKCPKCGFELWVRFG